MDFTTVAYAIFFMAEYCLKILHKDGKIWRLKKHQLQCSTQFVCHPEKWKLLHRDHVKKSYLKIRPKRGF